MLCTPRSRIFPSLLVLDSCLITVMQHYEYCVCGAQQEAANYSQQCTGAKLRPRSRHPTMRYTLPNLIPCSKPTINASMLAHVASCVPIDDSGQRCGVNGQYLSIAEVTHCLKATVEAGCTLLDILKSRLGWRHFDVHAGCNYSTVRHVINLPKG